MSSYITTHFNGLVLSGRGFCSAEGYITPVKDVWLTTKLQKIKYGEKSKWVNRKIPTAFARVFALSSDVIVGVQCVFKIQIPKTYQPKELLTT